MRVRLIGVMAMVLAVLAGVGANSAAAQSENDGSLYVSAYICPPGFEGPLYGDCQVSPYGDVEFSYRAAAPGAEEITFRTDGAGQGVVTIPSPPTGGVVTVPWVAGFESFVALCGLQDQEAPEQIMEYTADGSGIVLTNLPVNAEVACAFYFIPKVTVEPTDPPVADRDLTIYSAVCYNHPPNQDYFGECYDNVGEGNIFRVGVPNTDQFSENQAADEYGFAYFTAPNSDVIRMVQVVPEVAIDWPAYCTTTDGDVLDLTYNYDYLEQNLAVVDVDTTGTTGDIRCDWYVILSVNESPEPSAEPSVAPSEDPSAAPTATPSNVGGPTAPPVVGLPNTGAGASASESLMLVLSLAAAAMVAGAAMVGLRARKSA